VIERAVYRVRQFFHALAAPLAREDEQEARQALTRAGYALFLRQAPADRRHGLAVYRALAAQGARSPELLAAALLHDVGKSGVPFLLGVRVAVVLLERFAPRLWERLGRREARGWQRPLVAYRRHAERGAEWAAQAGCSELTAALIRRHHEEAGDAEGQDDFLAALQDVDEKW
jgi:predicted HD phosphohydrolase